MIAGVPPGHPVVAWYGDDFTGAAAVMEALTFGGLPAILFLDVPSAEQLAQFSEFGGIGIAGVARSKSPAWMNEALPPIYRFMEGLGAAITQYKVCSTFDSAPQVGSIGRAYDLAAPILGGAWTPMVVAAPAVHRYQVFGNLFASVGGVGYRLDRHSTMSRHPVTPMTEADLRIHLGFQTRARIGLIDIVTMNEGRANDALKAALANGEAIVSLDIADDETLYEAGRLIWENRGSRLFSIASQGLEYALLAYWRRSGLLQAPTTPARVASAPRIVVVSGSCSPITAEQIAWAIQNGFRGIRLDVRKATAESGEWQRELSRAVVAALEAVSAGDDPLVFTALGPNDPAVRGLQEAIAASGAEASAVSARIGEGLGYVLAEVLRRARLGRGIIAGGDTSSYATSALGIYALTAIASTGPGAALFRAHGDAAGATTLEVALKGGQMGSPDYFGRIKAGA